jgi:hypothetical protein
VDDPGACAAIACFVLEKKVLPGGRRSGRLAGLALIALVLGVEVAGRARGLS